MKDIVMIALILASVGVMATVDTPVDHFDMSVKPAADRVETVVLTEKETKLLDFYVKQGSSAPVEMAQATAKAKRPRLLAAVAVVESNARPESKGKAGEVTAWQIIEREWGSAGTTVDDHAKKAEEILEELIKRHDGNFRKALSDYNGDRSGKYAAKVLRKLREVPV